MRSREQQPVEKLNLPNEKLCSNYRLDILEIIEFKIIV